MEVIVLLAHRSSDECNESAQELAAMGPACLKLLRESVEKQGVARKFASKAAKKLEAAGFVLIRESIDQWEPIVTISPTLMGEEALAMLDNQE